MYVASLPFDGFCYHGNNCEAGWGILLFGFLGLVVGGQISWLANLLIIPAWLLLLLHSKASDGVAFMFGLGAIVVGNSFLFQGVSTSEAGGPLQQITSLGAGYWVWMGSITLSVVMAAHGVLTGSSFHGCRESLVSDSDFDVERPKLAALAHPSIRVFNPRH
ncbi:hypothetical protein LMG24238_02217 [Paraburkholderia sediminicola]|uniref:Transmembrane protein n=2 Tax=Paraburkholderia sediminicola TaxID=458836 RepID=A0A6J5ARG5_9BURK|nr:hypothetical protein LMG24238_02217 [Paraburkholderia sediminicola]